MRWRLRPRHREKKSNISDESFVVQKMWSTKFQMPKISHWVKQRVLFETESVAGYFSENFKGKEDRLC